MLAAPASARSIPSFRRFQPDALAVRIQDSEAKIWWSATALTRRQGGPQKKDADQALKDCPPSEGDRGERVGDKIGNIDWHPAATSGGTRRWPRSATSANPNGWTPKTRSSSSTPPAPRASPRAPPHDGGVSAVHAYTHKLAFDVHENDIWWCTADIGWVTATATHLRPSAMVHIPHVRGGPQLPTYSRFWQIVEKYKVTQFYTARRPSAPSPRREISGWRGSISPRSASSLRRRTLNPEAWHWYYSVIGRNQCPIVDTGGRPRRAAS